MVAPHQRIDLTPALLPTRRADLRGQLAQLRDDVVQVRHTAWYSGHTDIPRTDLFTGPVLENILRPEARFVRNLLATRARRSNRCRQIDVMHQDPASGR